MSDWTAAPPIKLSAPIEFGDTTITEFQLRKEPFCARARILHGEVADVIINPDGTTTQRTNNATVAAHLAFVYDRPPAVIHQLSAADWNACVNQMMSFFL